MNPFLAEEGQQGKHLYNTLWQQEQRTGVIYTFLPGYNATLAVTSDSRDGCIG